MNKTINIIGTCKDCTYYTQDIFYETIGDCEKWGEEHAIYLRTYPGGYCHYFEQKQEETR